MNQLLGCTLLLCLLTLAFSALVGDQRYGGHYSGNNLNRGGGGGYHQGPRRGGYSGPRGHGGGGYSGRQANSRAYGGHNDLGRRYGPAGHNQYGNDLGRRHGPGGAGRNQYGSDFGRRYGSGGAGHNQYAPAGPRYGGRSNYGNLGPAAPAPHYGGYKRSVYQPQPQNQAQSHSQTQTQEYHSSSEQYHSQPQSNSVGHHNSALLSSPRLGSGYPQGQGHSTFQQRAESKSQTHGREMKYTIRDPHQQGTTHVTETHIVSNRQMHGAEAEAAMKKLMGNMGGHGSYGGGGDAGFQDFFKNVGLPFY